MDAPKLPTTPKAAAESTPEKDKPWRSPQPPRGRGDEFVARWRAYARLMHETGILQDQFMPALEMLCDAHQQITDADEDLKANGGRYIYSDKGTAMAHPACVRRETAKRDVLKYQQELCLTPTTSGRKPAKAKTAVVETAKR